MEIHKLDLCTSNAATEIAMRIFEDAVNVQANYTHVEDVSEDRWGQMS
jgi:hypothetical protein